MILPTMTDEERGYEAFRMTDWLCRCYNAMRDDIGSRFAKGTKFPYYQRIKCDDDKGNTWWFTCLCPSKAFKKKGMYFTFCYTIYEIPPRRRENDVNSGKGVILFDPVSMRKKIKGEETSGFFICDITPHAFNRYTERYLKPKGLGDMEFNRKVESIMYRWQHFDVSADLYGDKNAAKHKDDGLCPYDIMMKGGGILRGTMMDGVFIRFNTYVSDDMLFDNQRERQEEMLREHYEWKRKGLKE